MARREILIVAIPLGLALGAALWLASGPADSRAVAAAQTRLQALPRARAGVALARGVGAQALLSLPLFNQSGPVRQLAIKLEGIARSPGRMAALLSIDGAAGQWLNVGDAVSGVTLESVSASAVWLDTPSGARELALGSSLGPAVAVASPSPASAGMLAGADSGPPPGFRGPPPPASAPGGVP